MRAIGPTSYPPGRATAVVDRLHGMSCPTRTAGWRTGTSQATTARPAAQDALWHDYAAALPGGWIPSRAEDVRGVPGSSLLQDEGGHTARSPATCSRSSSSTPDWISGRDRVR